jgi:hypothetical protein
MEPRKRHEGEEIMKLVYAAALVAALAPWSVPVAAPAAASDALLYASSSNNGLCGVNVFDQSEPTHAAVRTLAGLSACSRGMAVDAHGSLYVTQLDPNEPVLVFKAGASKPSLILTNTQSSSIPLATATDVAVASDGTVYVLLTIGDPEQNNLGVLVYAAGKKAPSKFLQYTTSMGDAMCQPTGIAVDAKKDVYMSCNALSNPNNSLDDGFEMTGGVVEFAAGGTTATQVITDAAAEWGPYAKSELGFCGQASGVQVDSKGNILVLTSSCYESGAATPANAVFVYAPGDIARPSRVIPIGGTAATITSNAVLRLDASEKYFFVNNTFNSTAGTLIRKFSYPAGKLIATFDKNGSGGGIGFAVSPSAPLAP